MTKARLFRRASFFLFLLFRVFRLSTEKSQWVKRSPATHYFEMQVRAGGVSRIAGASNALSLLYSLPFDNQRPGVMRVFSHIAVAVVDGNKYPVSTGPPGKGDNAIVSR